MVLAHLRDQYNNTNLRGHMGQHKDLVLELVEAEVEAEVVEAEAEVAEAEVVEAEVAEVELEVDLEVEKTQKNF